MPALPSLTLTRGVADHASKLRSTAMTRNQAVRHPTAAAPVLSRHSGGGSTAKASQTIRELDCSILCILIGHQQSWRRLVHTLEVSSAFKDSSLLYLFPVISCLGNEFSLRLEHMQLKGYSSQNKCICAK